MATYTQLSRGDTGDEVKTLQEYLNNNGYSLDVDGSFGPATQSAVKDYQSKNNLTVDGIVGNATWGALTSVTDTTDSTEATEAVEETPKYEAYTPSESVTAAEQLLNQQVANKPADYQSTWSDSLNDAIQQILNREPFSYDLNQDALYKMLTDQYVAQGRMAMMDTMGQAAALTGGYGNSYAQSVGQQAYQSYLQQLNDRVPELYQMALERYQLEGDELANRYGILANQESMDYGRYQDALSAYLAERDYLAGRYDSERDYDYSKYMNDLNFAYQQERDEIADQQWQAQFDEAVRQYNEQSSKSSSSGSSGGSKSYSYYDNDDDDDDVKPTASNENYFSTGYNYTSVKNYIDAKGGSSAGLLTQQEWQRERNKYLNFGIVSSNQSANYYITGYGTYDAYLKAFMANAV